MQSLSIVKYIISMPRTTFQQVGELYKNTEVIYSTSRLRLRLFFKQLYILRQVAKAYTCVGEKVRVQVARANNCDSEKVKVQVAKANNCVVECKWGNFAKTRELTYYKQVNAPLFSSTYRFYVKLPTLMHALEQKDGAHIL